MSKINFLTIAVIVLLLLNAASLFFIFRGHAARPPLRNDKGPGDFIVQQLQLDDKQQAAFEALKKEHHQISLDVQQEDKRLHDLYFSMLKSDTPDKNKADSIADLIAAQRKTIATATFDHFQKLRALCRDDQKKKFDEIIEDIIHHMEPPPPGEERPPHEF